MQFSAAAQVQLVLEYGEIVEGDRVDSCAASSSSASTTGIPVGPAAAPVSVAPSPMRVRRRWR